jgi:hypothetical protein
MPPRFGGGRLRSQVVRNLPPEIRAARLTLRGGAVDRRVKDDDGGANAVPSLCHHASELAAAQNSHSWMQRGRHRKVRDQHPALINCIVIANEDMTSMLHGTRDSMKLSLGLAVGCLFVASAVGATSRGVQPPTGQAFSFLGSHSIPRVGKSPVEPLDSDSPTTRQWMETYLADTVGTLVRSVDPQLDTLVPAASVPASSVLARPAVSLSVDVALDQATLFSSKVQDALTRSSDGPDAVASAQASLVHGLNSRVRVDCAALDEGASLFVRTLSDESIDTGLVFSTLGVCAPDVVTWSPVIGFVAANDAHQSSSLDEDSGLLGNTACTTAGQSALRGIGVQVHSSRGHGCGVFHVGEQGLALDTASPPVAKALSAAAHMIIATDRAIHVARDRDSASQVEPSPILLHFSARVDDDAALGAELKRVLAKAFAHCAEKLSNHFSSRLAVAVLALPDSLSTLPRSAAQDALPSKVAKHVETLSRSLLAGKMDDAVAKRVLAVAATGSPITSEGEILSAMVLNWTGVGLAVAALAVVIAVMSAGFEPLDRKLVARLAAFGGDRAHVD